jgi:hypothetical protein
VADLDQAAKQEIIDRAYSLAFKYEVEYWACSRCALRAMQEIFGRRFDYYSQEDMEAMEAAGAHRDKCRGVAANAARFAAQVLLEAEQEGEVREPSGGICTVCARAGDPA